MEESLFALPPIEESDSQPIGRGKERLKRAHRDQIEWQAVDLESLLPSDHMARVVWDWSQSLDIEPLLSSIQAIEGHPGQNAIDPHILLALWLYATLEGVGSARSLERLCEEHLAYRWICGGVGVNYHTLADFRVGHAAYLDRVFIESVAALQSEGLVEMKRVAQDGKKIRASAGGSSFHRKDTLTRLQEEAKMQVETLRQEVTEDPGSCTRRQIAAQERAQRERQARLKKAQEQVEDLRQQDKKTKNSARKKERRASSTDPESRVMRMANSGFDPAYNAQFCTDCGSDIIVGMAVSQQGNDTGLASPMMEQIETHYQVRVEEVLADTSYASLEEIPRLARKGITCFIGVP